MSPSPSLKRKEMEDKEKEVKKDEEERGGEIKRRMKKGREGEEEKMIIIRGSGEVVHGVHGLKPHVNLLEN